MVLIKPSVCLFIIISYLYGCIAQGNEKVDRHDNYDNHTDWAIYRGDKKANQYAELGQIHAANVHNLVSVWEYHTGDANERSSMQCNPIIVNGLLYVSTPTLKAVAIDAVSGEEVWTFESSKYNEENKVFRGRSRGVTYWEGPEGPRIFHFVKDRVYALDAKSGALIKSFGNNGFIDLRQNLDVDPATASIEVTSPGIVYKNFLIVASRVPEGFVSTPGHIRAYDTVTGAFKWIFHTIPQEGEFGYDTWEWVEGETYGGANAWGGFSVDEERGWVFFATGSPSSDFYGAYRKGKNLFGNCVLALDATTGERQWYFQTVHHDLWDYDNPPAPILVTLTSGKETRDAVVQLTKMGLTFVLDRDTGEPLFPMEEVPVPTSKVPGEETWPTQPFPSKPPPLNRLSLTEADLTHITPESYITALEQFRKYESGSIYTPPTTPGHQGGVEWHGASFDPYLNALYVNVNDAPSINKLREIYSLKNNAVATPAQLGSLLYQKNCMSCHGADRQGVPPVYPSLIDLQIDHGEIEEIVRQGRGIMPAFTQFSQEEVNAITAYLENDVDGGDLISDKETQVRYLIEGYDFFNDPYGVPAISPPWGTLNAIDLNKGEILWKVPLGEYPELAAKGIRHTGTKNFGGAVATAGDVIFIGATADEKFRAFEKHSGKILWEYQLPAGGYATPSVYMIDKKQYVVIVAGGGGKNGTKSGDAIIVFALPSSQSEAQSDKQKSEAGWIELFDGTTLHGWVHLNGSHTYTVEDGAIVGRTVEGSQNSFLCTTQEFDDFELEVEVWVDSVTNSGIQFRSQVRPITVKDNHNFRAGRVYGPQAEIRRYQGKGIPTTGVLYGEALGTGWLSSEETIEKGHRHYKDESWNHLRIVAKGSRMQTWVNGHPIEDLTNEEVYQTHPKGFIGLQIHGIEGQGPFVMKWRNIRISSL